MILFASSSNVTRMYKPRVFSKIPEYMVEERINGFLIENDINNCYQFLEASSHLLLKCWGVVFDKKQLFEVNIIVKKEYLDKIGYVLNS